MLLCTDDENATAIGAGGAGADQCPDGSFPFVRWEWSGDRFVPEDDPQGTTVNATDFKEPGEPVEANWTSMEYDVTGVVVGAGGDTCVYEDENATGDNGTVETCEGPAGNSGSMGANEGDGTLLDGLLDRIASLTPPNAGASAVVPLAFFALGSVLIRRRR